MSKFIGKVKSVVSFRSSRSNSPRAGSDLEVDPSSPAVGSSSCSAPEETFTLLRDKLIKLQDDHEKNIFRELKDQEFTDTPAFNLALLQMIGMDSEFELVFNNVGWKNSWELNEQGCRLLTIEFLCTLQPGDTEVSFSFSIKNFPHHGRTSVGSLVSQNNVLLT
jgi:hypothetical protein